MAMATTVGGDVLTMMATMTMMFYDSEDDDDDDNDKDVLTAVAHFP